MAEGCEYPGNSDLTIARSLGCLCIVQSDGFACTYPLYHHQIISDLILY